MNWLKVNFSQAFSAWLHLKALRVFTESVLRSVPLPLLPPPPLPLQSHILIRYGLPVNFLSIVVKPHRKHNKKVHELLKDGYGFLDSKFVASDIEVS